MNIISLFIHQTRLIYNICYVLKCFNQLTQKWSHKVTAQSSNYQARFCYIYKIFKSLQIISLNVNYYMESVKFTAFANLVFYIARIEMIFLMVCSLCWFLYLIKCDNVIKYTITFIYCIFVFIFLYINRLGKLLCTYHLRKAIMNVFSFFSNSMLTLTLVMK